MGRIYNRFCQSYHQVNILQNACASTFTNHFFYRTSIININNIRLNSFHNPRGHCHRFLITTKNLNPNRSFVIENIQLFSALNRITNQAFRRDKLRIHQVCAVHFAQFSERRITHILHRSQKKWKIRKFYVANFYHSAKIMIHFGTNLKSILIP